MIGYKNILLVFVEILLRNVNALITHAHAVVHTIRPHTNKEITISVVTFSKRKDIDWDSPKYGEYKSDDYHPNAPKYI